MILSSPLAVRHIWSQIANVGMQKKKKKEPYESIHFVSTK